VEVYPGTLAFGIYMKKRAIACAGEATILPKNRERGSTKHKEIFLQSSVRAAEITLTLQRHRYLSLFHLLAIGFK